jgi:hypothetical protein
MRSGVTFYAEPYRSFKKALRQWFVVNGPGELGPETGPWCTPVRVKVAIWAKRPKATKLSAPRPDVDNYAKAVLDAMNGVIVHDDTLVQHLEVTKKWAPVGDPGRIVVHVDNL